MNLPKIENLKLVTDREFPARTPHTYAHIGQQVLAEVIEFPPKVYELPPFHNGAAGSGA